MGDDASRLLEEHVLNCMFSSWYPNFKQHTFSTEIIPLAEEFVQYLQEDGTIYLPKSAHVGRKSDPYEEYAIDEWHNDDEKISLVSQNEVR